MRSSWRFALFNHIINPVVGRILRSPAHRLLRGLMLLTITGRVSGQSFTIPVGYRRDGRRLTVPVGSAPEKRWWRNRRGAPVTVLLDGRDLPARAEAIGTEEAGVTVVIDLSAAAPR